MGWLKNILKGSSSSYKSKSKEDNHGNCGVLETDEPLDTSSSAEECCEDNRVIDRCYSYDGHQYFENQKTIHDYHEYEYSTSPAWYRQEDVEYEQCHSGHQWSLSGEDDPFQQHDVVANFISNPSASYTTWDEYDNVGMNVEWLLGYGHAYQNPPERLESNLLRGQEITEYKFTEIDQSYLRPLRNPYYSSIICDVCEEPVPLDSNGIPQYKDMTIFHQKHCIRHLHDGTARCFSCERLEPRQNRYLSYADGRKICKDCKKSAIMDKRDCKPLLEEIIQFYEDLGMKVRQENIAIVMLDEKKMNEGHRGSAIALGITETEERSAIITMIETPRFGHKGNVIGIKKQPFKLASHKHVREIRLLNGCPRLYTGETLAHEMMHAWLHLEGYHMFYPYESFCGPMGEDIEEGVCEVLAHMWIDSKIRTMPIDVTSSSSEQQFESKLAKHLKRNIENSTDPIYGDGFRIAFKAVKKHGLKGMLNYVRMIGRFPE